MFWFPRSILGVAFWAIAILPGQVASADLPPFSPVPLVTWIRSPACNHRIIFFAGSASATEAHVLANKYNAPVAFVPQTSIAQYPVELRRDVGQLLHAIDDSRARWDLYIYPSFSELFRHSLESSSLAKASGTIHVLGSKRNPALERLIAQRGGGRFKVVYE